MFFFSLYKFVDRCQVHWYDVKTGTCILPIPSFAVCILNSMFYESFFVRGLCIVLLVIMDCCSQISAAVFVSTPYILLKIQSTNFPFLKKCAHRYPQITISRVSHAFNILWWNQMYWFFSVSPCIQSVFI